MPNDSQPQELSIEEINERFNGKWILLEVTGFDEQRVPRCGRVVAKGARRTVWSALSDLGSEGRGLSRPYFVFAAYPRVRNGAGLQSALAEAATHEEKGPRWYG